MISFPTHKMATGRKALINRKVIFSKKREGEDFLTRTKKRGTCWKEAKKLPEGSCGLPFIIDSIDATEKIC